MIIHDQQPALRHARQRADGILISFLILLTALLIILHFQSPRNTTTTINDLPTDSLEEMNSTEPESYTPDDIYLGQPAVSSGF